MTGDVPFRVLHGAALADASQGLPSLGLVPNRPNGGPEGGDVGGEEHSLAETARADGRTA